MKLITTSYTTKLFFGKYNIKIVVSTNVNAKKTQAWRWPKPKELHVLHNWCKEHFSSSDYVIKDHWATVEDNICFHQMCYLSDPSDKEKLLKEFGPTVIEITQPLDEEHNSQLEVRNITVVRDTLLYNLYKYCVYFKYDPTQETWRWLVGFLKDEPGVKLMPSAEANHRYPVWPRVYLEDDTHLVTLKLMWQEKIDYIKSVHLISAQT